MTTDYKRFESIDSELRYLSGSTVRVLRELTDSECDPECQPMYRVRFPSGLERDAFCDELHPLS